MRNRSENQIELVWIRHGATKANKERRYLGQKTDEPLSAEGIGRLQRQKAEGKYPAVDCLFSGPMKRCRETAEILYPDKRAVIVPEWKETDFGAFEGKNYTQLQGDRRYQAWIDSGGRLPFPEGESREAFADRCKRGFNRVTEALSAMDVSLKKPERERPLRVGLIVHGGTIMALFSCFFGGDYYDYQVSNGDGYRYILSMDRGVTLQELRPLLQEEAL